MNWAILFLICGAQQALKTDCLSTVCSWAAPVRNEVAQILVPLKQLSPPLYAMVFNNPSSLPRSLHILIQHVGLAFLLRATGFLGTLIATLPISRKPRAPLSHALRDSMLVVVAICCHCQTGYILWLLRYEMMDGRIVTHAWDAGLASIAVALALQPSWAFDFSFWASAVTSLLWAILWSEDSINQWVRSLTFGLLILPLWHPFGSSESWSSLFWIWVFPSVVFPFTRRRPWIVIGILTFLAHCLSALPSPRLLTWPLEKTGDPSWFALFALSLFSVLFMLAFTPWRRKNFWTRQWSPGPI